MLKGSSTPAGDSSALEDDEPFVEAVNGVAQPPFIAPPHRPGRLTNQLKYLNQVVVKAIWRHHFSWPFQTPVDAVSLKIPVSVIISQCLVIGKASVFKNKLSYLTISGLP